MKQNLKILIIFLFLAESSNGQENDGLNLGKLAQALGVQLYNYLSNVLNQISLPQYLPKFSVKKEGNLFNMSGSAEFLGQKININIITKKILKN